MRVIFPEKLFFRELTGLTCIRCTDHYVLRFTGCDVWQSWMLLGQVHCGNLVWWDPNVFIFPLKMDHRPRKISNLIYRDVHGRLWPMMKYFRCSIHCHMWCVTEPKDSTINVRVSPNLSTLASFLSSTSFFDIGFVAVGLYVQFF